MFLQISRQELSRGLNLVQVSHDLMITYTAVFSRHDFLLLVVNVVSVFFSFSDAAWLNGKLLTMAGFLLHRKNWKEQEKC